MCFPLASSLRLNAHSLDGLQDVLGGRTDRVRLSRETGSFLAHARTDKSPLAGSTNIKYAHLALSRKKTAEKQDCEKNDRIPGLGSPR